MPRRLLLTALRAVVFASLIWAPSALADTFTPESGGSPNADDIDTLYKITLYIGIVIFLLVEGVLIWSLDQVPPPAAAARCRQQIRGNTPLEMGWTHRRGRDPGRPRPSSPSVYLTTSRTRPPPAPNGLQAVRGRSSPRSTSPRRPRRQARRCTIHVNGQQYIWRYDYSGQAQQLLLAYYEMVVPTDTTVILKINASDVIHSWWIPKLGGKADAVPGHMNETWFKILPEGRASTTGQCAELCGAEPRRHARAVRAVTPDAVPGMGHERQRERLKAAGEAAARKAAQG